MSRGHAAAKKGQGVVVDWTFAGPRSGIVRKGLVYLPAAYFNPNAGQLRFPVVELLHGYVGHPADWVTNGMTGILDAEIRARRMPPVIAVMPQIFVGNDSECVDAVRGQQNETYLAVDVPADTVHSFRALDTPGSWTTLGYSTGAFCAVNLALHHPGRYGAAGSLSGYFHAIEDSHTGNLYHGNAAAKRENSPVWWVRHHPVQTSLYLFAAAGDTFSAKETKDFAAQAPQGSDVRLWIAPAGGHNWRVWSAVLPAALDWLGGRMRAPTAAPLVEGGGGGGAPPGLVS
jgi:S-formylglutathione hydrolase FrmB